MLLVEALHSLDLGRVMYHARALEAFSARNGIRLSLILGASGISKPAPATTFPSPFASPLITGSFPPSPLFYSPDCGPQRRIDMVPPLSLDGIQSGKSAASPPMSPSARRQLSLPVRSLHERLQNTPQVGIIHLALQNDSIGSILWLLLLCPLACFFYMTRVSYVVINFFDAYFSSWQNDVFVVAEPGDLADKFLQSVKFSLLSTMRSRHKKLPSVLANISSVADLVHIRPYFQVGNVVHRYIGRQTQVYL